MAKPFSLEFWLPGGAIGPDHYEEYDNRDEISQQIEIARREGRYVYAEVWQRGDRPNAWDRIETIRLLEPA